MKYSRYQIQCLQDSFYFRSIADCKVEMSSIILILNILRRELRVEKFYFHHASRCNFPIDGCRRAEYCESPLNPRGFSRSKC